jgi:hypothetical protein
VKRFAAGVLLVLCFVAGFFGIREWHSEDDAARPVEDTGKIGKIELYPVNDGPPRNPDGSPCGRPPYRNCQPSVTAAVDVRVEYPRARVGGPTGTITAVESP